jgi:hypothetical protein
MERRSLRNDAKENKIFPRGKPTEEEADRACQGGTGVTTRFRHAGPQKKNQKIDPSGSLTLSQTSEAR